MIERLLRLLAGRGLPRATRYGAATLVVLAAAAVRGLLSISGLPFLFFVPALMGVAFALGRDPGFFATACPSWWPPACSSSRPSA